MSVNIGDVFGNWTVIDYAEDRIDSSGKHHKRVLCKCGCGNQLIKDIYKLKSGQKMCKQCYLKKLPKNGMPFQHKTNKYDLSGDYGIGWTSNTNNKFYFDLEDYDKIKDICWCEKKSKSLTTLSGTDTKNGKTVNFTHVIVGTWFDHINRNRLDNRKSNLRKCTQQQNTFNRSLPSNNTTGKVGVSFDNKVGKYHSYIKHNGVLYNLGYFDDLNDAISARIKAELKYYGEFAPCLS